MDQKPQSVTELNTYLMGLVNRDAALLNVCVQGELSNYTIHSRGTHFFTMKDANSTLKCVMFQSAAAHLRFQPKNGMEVTAYGRISVYIRDGVYQLYCTSLEQKRMGDLQAAFEALKAKLSAEGLFEDARKKPIPAFPEKIAVITSSTGDAVHDIISGLKSHWPLAKVIVMPVRVQGKGAELEIAGAIRYANEFQIADLIITGRGGGSLEELWAFNEETLARAIAASRIPVISAVGHEPDNPISDYVADRRAFTPTRAAEVAVPDWKEVQQRLETYGVRAGQALEKDLRLLEHRLDSYRSRRVLQDPSVYLDNRRLDLDHAQDRLLAAMDRVIAAKRQGFVRLASSLDAMSPLSVLSRGYAIASDEEGNVIKSAAELSRGQRISLRLSSGSAKCTVEQLNKGEEVNG